MRKKTTPKLYQKKDGNWYCTFKGRQRYLGKNLQVANEKLEQIIIDPNVKSGDTIQKVVDSYIASLDNNQSPDTIRTKTFTCEVFLKFVGEKTSIRSITPDKVEDFKQKQLKSGLKRQTVRGRVNNLSALFEYAKKRGLIKTNPLREIPAIKNSEDPDPDHLTDEEIEMLMGLTEGQRYPWLEHRDRLVFTLILHAGLRRIEVSNLKWSDVDLDRKVIVVRNGKGQKHRVVGISETLSSTLKDFDDNWKRGDEYVVTNRSGAQVSREALSHLARKYVDKLNHHYQGRKRFGLHALRATFATRLAGRGVGTRVIQGLLGHKSPKTTMRYACYTEKMAVEAVKVLDV